MGWHDGQGGGLIPAGWEGGVVGEKAAGFDIGRAFAPLRMLGRR